MPEEDKNNEPNGVITPRQILWQPHHPDKVTIIGKSSLKQEQEPRLEVEGKLVSPAEAFEMAKTEGNKDAAFAYARYVIESNPQAVEVMIQQHGDKNPILLHVSAIESTKNGPKFNAIPEAFAVILSDKTGWPIQGSDVGEQIVQSNRAGRTGAERIDRMVSHASFAGVPEKERNYILCDDHFTNGGTFRGLLDHIEQGGGKVVGITALINGRTDDKFKSTERDYSRAQNMLGKDNFNKVHERMFGASCKESGECRFTAGEVSQLITACKEIETKIQEQYNDGRSQPAPKGKQLQGQIYEEFDRRLTVATERRREAARSRAAASAVARGSAEPEAGIDDNDRGLSPEAQGREGREGAAERGPQSLEASSLPQSLQGVEGIRREGDQVYFNDKPILEVSPEGKFKPWVSMRDFGSFIASHPDIRAQIIANDAGEFTPFAVQTASKQARVEQQKAAAEPKGPAQLEAKPQESITYGYDAEKTNANPSLRHKPIFEVPAGGVLTISGAEHFATRGDLRDHVAKNMNFALEASELLGVPKEKVAAMIPPKVPEGADPQEHMIGKLVQEVFLPKLSKNNGGKLERISADDAAKNMRFTIMTHSFGGHVASMTGEELVKEMGKLGYSDAEIGHITKQVLQVDYGASMGFDNEMARFPDNSPFNRMQLVGQNDHGAKEQYTTDISDSKARLLQDQHVFIIDTDHETMLGNTLKTGPHDRTNYNEGLRQSPETLAQIKQAVHADVLVGDVGGDFQANRLPMPKIVDSAAEVGKPTVNARQPASLDDRIHQAYAAQLQRLIEKVEEYHGPETAKRISAVIQPTPEYAAMAMEELYVPESKVEVIEQLGRLIDNPDVLKPSLENLVRLDVEPAGMLASYLGEQHAIGGFYEQVVSWHPGDPESWDSAKQYWSKPGQERKYTGDVIAFEEIFPESQKAPAAPTAEPVVNDKPPIVEAADALPQRRAEPVGKPLQAPPPPPAPKPLVARQPASEIRPEKVDGLYTHLADAMGKVPPPPEGHVNLFRIEEDYGKNRTLSERFAANPLTKNSTIENLDKLNKVRGAALPPALELPQKAADAVRAGGRWFGDNIEDIEYYLGKYGEEGAVVRISMITVPKEQAEKYQITNQETVKADGEFARAAKESRNPAHEFFMPEEVAQSRQTVTTLSGAELQNMTRAEIEQATNKLVAHMATSQEKPELANADGISAKNVVTPDARTVSENLKTEPHALQNSKMVVEHPTVSFVETQDGSMRIFAPGYRHGQPSPTAWMEVSSERLPEVHTGGMMDNLNVLQIQDGSVSGKFLVEVNLSDTASIARFNELSGGNFSGRVDALHDVMRFQDASRGADYNSEIPRPPIADAFNRSYNDMQKATGAWRVAENNLRIGGYGTTAEEVETFKADAETKIKQYEDFQQAIRDGYLRKQGFEPLDPLEVRDKYLGVDIAGKTAKTPIPEQRGIGKASVTEVRLAPLEMPSASLVPPKGEVEIPKPSHPLDNIEIIASPPSPESHFNAVNQRGGTIVFATKSFVDNVRAYADENAGMEAKGMAALGGASDVASILEDVGVKNKYVGGLGKVMAPIGLVNNSIRALQSDNVTDASYYVANAGMNGGMTLGVVDATTKAMIASRAAKGLEVSTTLSRVAAAGEYAQFGRIGAAASKVGGITTAIMLGVEAGNLINYYRTGSPGMGVELAQLHEAMSENSKSKEALATPVATGLAGNSALIAPKIADYKNLSQAIHLLEKEGFIDKSKAGWDSPENLTKALETAAKTWQPNYERAIEDSYETEGWVTERKNWPDRLNDKTLVAYVALEELGGYDDKKQWRSYEARFNAAEEFANKYPDEAAKLKAIDPESFRSEAGLNQLRKDRMNDFVQQIESGALTEASYQAMHGDIVKASADLRGVDRVLLPAPDEVAFVLQARKLEQEVLKPMEGNADFKDSKESLETLMNAYARNFPSSVSPEIEKYRDLQGAINTLSKQTDDPSAQAWATQAKLEQYQLMETLNEGLNGTKDKKGLIEKQLESSRLTNEALAEDVFKKEVYLNPTNFDAVSAATLGQQEKLSLALQQQENARTPEERLVASMDYQGALANYLGARKQSVELALEAQYAMPSQEQDIRLPLARPTSVNPFAEFGVKPKSSRLQLKLPVETQAPDKADAPEFIVPLEKKPAAENPRVSATEKASADFTKLLGAFGLKTESIEVVKNIVQSMSGHEIKQVDEQQQLASLPHKPRGGAEQNIS